MIAASEDIRWQEEVKIVGYGIRRRVLEHTIKHGGGYLSQACSSAEVLATLYVRVMKLGPSVAPKIPPPFPGVPSQVSTASFTGAGTTVRKRPTWIDSSSPRCTMHWRCTRR
jgi:transketolase